MAKAIRTYRVTWEIDIDATSPKAAAKKAREYQIDPDSTATVFDVFNENGKVTRVDLMESN
jgi:hypothetical protein